MLDDKPPADQKPPSSAFVGGFIAAMLLAGAAFLIWQQLSGAAAPTAGPRVSSHQAQVTLDIGPFRFKPHEGVFTTDQALKVTDAVRHGDYALAEALTAEVLSHSVLQSWSFHPFNMLMGGLNLGNDPTVLKNLSAWVEADPKSAMARLLRAKAYYQTGWDIRGEDTVSMISQPHMEAFEKYVDKADEDVRRSIALNPDNPWSYWFWLSIRTGGGNSAGMDEAFRKSIDRFPTYYELYRQRLYTLTPKWGGSVEAMGEFVDHYAGKAPDGSPLKLLYLQMSAHVLDAALFACHSAADGTPTECVNAYLNRYAASLSGAVAKSASIYRSSEPIQYSNALWPILGQIVNMRQGADFMSPMVQQLASAMGSDVQLIHGPKANNFVIDDITARIWAELGNSANVDQKFKEALDDLERTTFPNDEEKGIAQAGILDDMTQVARNANQYLQIITYHDAANTVGGINHGGQQYFKCFSFFKLQRFQDAVDECTLVLNTYGDSLSAHYYRARANEALQNWDASLAEFEPIAEGEGNFIRVGAAIDMAHINALRGKYAEELRILDKYSYLFDESMQPPEDLAVSYNNRCFAFMKLGQLKEALDDCETSLKYGQLPDALQKRQELTELLKNKTTL